MLFVTNITDNQLLIDVRILSQTLVIKKKQGKILLLNSLSIINFDSYWDIRYLDNYCLIPKGRKIN